MSRLAFGIMGAALTLCDTGSLVAAAQISAIEIDNPIHEATWSNRLLAVCTKTGTGIDTSIMQQQYDAADWAEYEDRDLILVAVSQDELVSWLVLKQPDGSLTIANSGTESDKTSLRDRIGCNGETEFVALVGKDGGLKRTWERVAPNEEVFATIDAMPMRRQEMRDK